MIDEEIKMLLNSGKGIQWKAIQLQNIGAKVYEQFNKDEFQNHITMFAPELQSQIESHQRQVIEIEKKLLENAALIKQRDDIEAKHKQLSLEDEKLKDLEEKSKAIMRFSKVVTQISDKSKTNFEEVENIVKELKELNKVITKASADWDQALSANLLTAERNLEVIANIQSNTLEKLEAYPIQKYAKEFAEKVQKLIADYNSYVTEVNNYRETQAEVINLFKEHHIENENIYNALRKRKVALGSLETLNKEIKERLQRYDDDLKSTVERRDRLPIYQLEETKIYQ